MGKHARTGELCGREKMGRVLIYDEAAAEVMTDCQGPGSFWKVSKGQQRCRAMCRVPVGSHRRQAARLGLLGAA